MNQTPKPQRSMTEMPVGFAPIQPGDEVHLRETDRWMRIVEVGESGKWVYFHEVHTNHKGKKFRVPQPIHVDTQIDKFRRMI